MANTKEAIFRIKVAEEQARKILKDANEKAQAILNEAEQLAEASFEKILQEGRNEVEEIKRQAYEKGQAKRADIEKDGASLEEAIIALTDEDLEKAVQAIVERVVDYNGNP